MLFWQDIGPIRFTNGEVFPIEDSQPRCGFKLGPSTTTEYLPLSVCEVAGFGVLVLFTNTNRDVDISTTPSYPLKLLRHPNSVFFWCMPSVDNCDKTIA